jgi:catechol 2,3-dioxygenase-like lactoylglutathione lyase family enzyme
MQSDLLRQAHAGLPVCTFPSLLMAPSECGACQDRRHEVETLRPTSLEKDPMKSDHVPDYVGLTPMLPVTNVARAIEFYGRLGFRTGHTHTPEGDSTPVWAWLYSGQAHLMVNQADSAIEATHHSASVWLYTQDVKAAHAILKSRGLDVGEIEYPFYNTGGEFHVHDPDGYAIFIAHADQR